MKRFFADDLKTFSTIIFIVSLAALLSIGGYACMVVTSALTDNAEKAALSHLKSSDSVLFEKIKNIQRFVDLANVSEDLNRLLNDTEDKSNEVFAAMRSLVNGFEEIDGCVLINDAGKGYSYNLQALNEDNLIQLQISCPHLSGKNGVLKWYNVDLGEAANPIFNKYVICGTTIFDDHTVKLYMFVRKNLFDQIIGNSTDDAIVAVLDEEGRVIASNDETLFRSRFNASNSNFLSTYALSQGLFEFKAEGSSYIGVHSQSGYTNFKFLEIYPKRSFYGELYKIAVFVVIIAGISLCILISLYEVLRKRFVQPLAKLSHIMKNFDETMLDETIDIRGSREIVQITDGLNNMIGNVNAIIEDAKRKEKEKKQAELSALRYQIHPHFLYNTLNSIRILALYNKQTEIAKSIQVLARLLKNLLSQESVLPLSKEFEFIRDYVDLLQLRYKNMIDVSYEMDASLGTCEIPNMLLQPVIENAVSHGLAEKLAGQTEPAKLYINAHKENGMLLIEVTDNGVGMNDEKVRHILSEPIGAAGGGIGLRNIVERIKLLYGDAYGVSVTSQEGFFTTVTIRLPIR